MDANFKSSTLMENNNFHNKNDFPKEALWIMNNMCNADCIMCKLKNKHRTLGLSKSEIYRVIENLKDCKIEKLFFQGGELTLRDDLIQILEKAHESGFSTVLTTNGSNLSRDCINQLNNTGLGQLTVSIDSHLSNLHDEIRRFPGLHERLVDGIKYFRKINPEIYIKINTVVLNKNYRELDKIVDIANEIGVNTINFIQVTNYDKNLKNVLTKQQMEEFYFEVVPKIIRKAGKIRLHFSPFFSKLRNRSREDILYELANSKDKFEDELERFSKGKYYSKCESDCKSIFSRFFISITGNVHPCCRLGDSDVVMGNLLNQKFRDIWNSEKYKTFRKNPEHRLCSTCISNCIFV